MLELRFNSRSQIGSQTSASSNVCTVKLQIIQRVDLSDIIVHFLLHWQQEQLIRLVRARLPLRRRACFTDTGTNAPYHLKTITFFLRNIAARCVLLFRFLERNLLLKRMSGCFVLT